MKLFPLMLPLFILSVPALALAAEELVISGIVLDTASTANNDRPLGSVLVEILAPDGSRLGETTTRANGMFHIKIDDKDSLTGKETIRVDASGYSARPTSQQIKLARAKGMKLAYQGEFLLTNNKAIREVAAYRESVAKNAADAHAQPGQSERARRVFASISALPSESKVVAFGSVQAISGPAFSELVKVDKEVTWARELQEDFKQKGSLIVPQYDPVGKLRLTGPVKSKSEMDALLVQANQKGFREKAVINDMRIGKQ